jgi:hypothetical protein
MNDAAPDLITFPCLARLAGMLPFGVMILHAVL